jgi:hypothetical protein
MAFLIRQPILKNRSKEISNKKLIESQIQHVKIRAAIARIHLSPLKAIITISKQW